MSSFDMDNALDVITAREWLKFLLKRQPHKSMELKHRYSQLDASPKARRAALRRLDELAVQYPQDYLVFKTQRRLLGK
jgi:hypothetical protein